MAYRCPAHRSLFRVNLVLFFAPRLFSMPGFYPLCTYCPPCPFILSVAFCGWYISVGFLEVSTLCVSNSRVNLFSVLRPRLFFRALIFLLGLPGDFPCPFNLSVAFRV